MKTANFSVGRADWVSALLAVASIALSVALLWSVRLDFTGPAYDGTKVSSRQGVFLSMPAFSDEWVMAGFVQKTAERGGRPDFHPLDSSAAPAENVLAPLVLILAGTMRASGLDIVSSYFAFLFAFQLAFVLSFYAFVRACKVSVASSLACVVILLSLPASNIISGIWIMIPAYIGIMFLMLSYAAFAKRNSIQSCEEGGVRWRRKRAAWGMASGASLLLACVLYPPFLILASAYIVISAVKRLAFGTVLAFMTSLAIIGFLFAQTIGVRIYSGNIGPLWHSFLAILAHSRFGVSTAAVWGYMPIWFYAISAAGLFLWLFGSKKAIDKREKTAIAYCAFACASVLAIAYSIDIEFVLSHQRAVFAAWIMLIAMFGFCIDRIAHEAWSAISRRRLSASKGALSARAWILSAMAAIALAQGLLLASGAYPSLARWEGVSTREHFLLEKVDASPVMTDMLPIGFEQAIESAAKEIRAADPAAHPRLLAPPHLALAISATTEMAPVSTVDSIVSVSGPSYARFRSLPSCEDRHRFAVNAKATHLLVHADEPGLVSGCPGFRLIGNLGSHYVLYAVI